MINSKKFPNCSFDCSKFDSAINDFDEMISNLEEERFEYSKNINFNKYKEGGIFEIIYNNYENIYKIMQINILLKNCKRIKNIITNCNELSCREVAEINSFLRPVKPCKKDNLNFISLAFEIYFGNIINEEQWEKFNAIFSNFKDCRNNPNQLREVHQFMMAKGKSSVITPLLLLNIYTEQIRTRGVDYYNSTYENIYLVLPSHLIKQAKEYLHPIQTLFNLHNFYIKSDNEMKENIILLNEEISSEYSYERGRAKDKLEDYIKNSVFIFDEFDMMFDPIQSNYNVQMSDDRVFFNLEDFDLVVKLLKDIDNNINFDSKLDFNNRVYKELNNNLIKNVNYGMSKIEIDNIDYIIDGKIYNRWVIPYARKDTPNEGSNFSSILTTFCFTIRYFKENNWNLEEKDFYNLYQVKYDDFYEFDETIEIGKNVSFNLFKQLCNQQQESLSIDEKIEKFRKYFEYFIMNKIKILMRFLIYHL